MQTLIFQTPIYITHCASIAGQKEAQGPFANAFDMTCDDDLFGCENWDEAETMLQKFAMETLISKTKLSPSDIDFLFAGDLLEQTTASSFGCKDYKIPYFGLYGACSTCGEALIVASVFLDSGHAGKCITVTSSHFASAEVEFRFPLHYGNERPLSATRTTTGCGAFLLVNSKNSTPNQPLCRITQATPGRMIDMGITDSMNMGAAMAPAAADTLKRHFQNTKSSPSDYDLIITGDLGLIGQNALIKLLSDEGIDISKNTLDCGRLLYGASKEFLKEMEENHWNLNDVHTQASDLNTGAGGSGCGCSATLLAAHFLPKLAKKELNKILFMPTGALLSKNSFQEGRTIPSIAHALVLESC